MHALAPMPHDDRRVDLRYFVNLPPVLLESESMAEHVQVVNIARRGFLAKTRLAYRTGDVVFLHLEHPGRLEARVIWCKNGMVGGQFTEAIEVSQVTEKLIEA